MKYTKEKVTEIARYVRSGIPNKYAAEASGINEDTFYEWMKSKSEFSEAIKKAEADAVARNVLIVEKEAEKTWQAAAWWLERRHRDDFATRQEFTGKEGERLMVSIDYVDHDGRPIKSDKRKDKPATKASRVQKGSR